MTTRAQLSKVAKNEPNHTDLMSAALEGNTQVVENLLKAGADPNTKDQEGRTALMFAVINIHGDVVKALLDSDANVNASDNDGCTPLLLAASTGDIGIVKALLCSDAAVSDRLNQTGKTALTIAREKGYEEVVSLLLGAGARE
jgi:cytohesin